MGDIARCSLGKDPQFHSEDLLYKLFGVNAELLIDHAWGWEPCTMADIKAYKPSSNSICSGQVLSCPYTNEKARLIVQEMADLLALNLVEKGLVSDQIILDIGYDIENLTDGKTYTSEVTSDHYGRKVPKPVHGSENLGRQTASTRLIMEAAMRLFDRITDKNLLVRRIHVTAAHLIPEDKASSNASAVQMDIFTDYQALKKKKQEEDKALEKEKTIQKTIITLKKKYGKNAVLKGMNLQEGATTVERNRQIGGHKE